MRRKLTNAELATLEKNDKLSEAHYRFDYKSNSVFQDQYGFYAVIVGSRLRYDSPSAIKTAISQCINNGWRSNSIRRNSA